MNDMNLPGLRFKEQLTQAAMATGLDNNMGLFAADSEFRKLSITPSTFFGAARALILQIAHPIVAQGVHDHSAFDTNPAARGFRTFAAVFAVSLGKQQFAIDIGKLVFDKHIPVKGVIPAYGDHAERKYHAMDPEANLWVWATLVEGIMFGHKEVNREIPRERLEKMYEESKLFGLFFNVKQDLIPETLDDFENYFQDMVENGLEVTPAGKEVADALIDGAKFPFTVFSWLYETLAFESLPENIKQDLGWESSDKTKKIYGGLRKVARIQNSLTPEFLKATPIVWYPQIRRKIFGPGKPVAKVEIGSFSR